MVRLSAPDRRETLLRATVETMLEKGFAGATTRDVAARLGIGRGLIHHYFATWEDLQRAAFAAVADAARDEAEAALATLTGLERLDALLDFLVADPEEAHWRLFADAWDEAQRDKALAALYSSIGQWWREKLADALHPLMAADPTDAAWRLVALADGLSSHVLLPQPPLTRAEAVRLLRDGARKELASIGASR